MFVFHPPSFILSSVNIFLKCLYEMIKCCEKFCIVYLFNLEMAMIRDFYWFFWAIFGYRLHPWGPSIYYGSFLEREGFFKITFAESILILITVAI